MNERMVPDRAEMYAVSYQPTTKMLLILFEHVSYLIYFRLIRLSFFIFMMNNWDI
jgi:hypothetical protein